MPNYKQTSTGAIADADFSEQIEKDRREAMKQYELYLQGKAPNPYETDNKGSKQSRMTRNKEDGGSVCGKPTGQGFGQARMR